MGDAQGLTEVRVLICRKLKLYGFIPFSCIFLQFDNRKKKMKVGQVKEVKGTRVLFRAVLLKVGCDDL